MDELDARIEQCLLIDRARLRRRLGAARADPSRRAGIERQIAAAIERRAQRERLRPTPTFDLDLPVIDRRDEIGEAIRASPVVVICGETGSGKTTQIPKICLDIGRGREGLIGHTQPRRIAARSVAARLTVELGAGATHAVAYKIRFGDRTGPATHVKLMTDGILLAETQADPMLWAYDTLIIDEAHERSLNIDFILGYLRQLMPRRPDLRVIVTSATIDPERLSRHFGGAPIIEVSGRTYPIEVRYRSEDATDAPSGGERGQSPAQPDAPLAGLLAAVDEVSALGPGDVLVFLPGEREIREAAEALRKHHPPRTHILPLYARLSAEEQNRVFQDHPGRRIVLATNVAETSLTVPGIRYVVDTGVARISRYNPRTRVLRLPIEPVSRASADQRAGRCGRVGPGVCVRLYSENDYRSRPAFTDPEIRRTNLAGAILQMKSLGLGEVESFPFVESPDARAIRDAYDALGELGALDETRRLTDLGRKLARLPVDPRLGRMILAADAEGALDEVLVIAAALSVQDPRERPMSSVDGADHAHKAFKDDRSDFLSILKLWNWHKDLASRLSRSKVRRECERMYVSAMRMREWADIHHQLLALATEMGHRHSSARGHYEPLHRALLTGLLSSVARKTDSSEYAGCRGTRLAIFPGSGLFHLPPKWIMAAEVVQTTRLWARTAAMIEPEWIESLAPHLLTRTYSEPHYREEGAFPAAYEKVTLLGLEVIPHRLVSLGPIDPVLARELFIRHGLVDGLLETGAPFQRHNLAMIEQVRSLEARARRHDLLASPETIFEFFNERLPADVWSGSRLARWRRRAEREHPRILYMPRELVMGSPEHAPRAGDFPDRARLDGVSTPIEYRMEPGESHDGLTLTVPLEALASLDEEAGEWLVPGLLAEKIEAMVRALPKAQRRNFGSITDFARRCAAEFEFAKGSLRARVAREVDLVQGSPVPPEVWATTAEGVPEHLRPRYRVVDPAGREIACSRDLRVLKRDLRSRSAAAVAGLHPRAGERLVDWVVNDLAREIEVRRASANLRVFPALADFGDHARVRTYPSAPEAEASHRAGVRRLVALALRTELRQEARLLPGFDALALLHAPLGPPRALRDALSTRMVERAAALDRRDVRTREAFDEAVALARENLDAASAGLLPLAGDILRLHQKVSLRLSELSARAFASMVADVRAQMGDLLTVDGPRHFMSDLPWERLGHLPRYLRAMEVRLARGTRAGLERDARLRAEAEPFALEYRRRRDAHAHEGVLDPELDRLRWMIEEFRVSLFAQELGTAEPVSPKRLGEQAARVRA